MIVREQFDIVRLHLVSGLLVMISAEEEFIVSESSAIAALGTMRSLFLISSSRWLCGSFCATAISHASEYAVAHSR